MPKYTREEEEFLRSTWGDALFEQVRSRLERVEEPGTGTGAGQHRGAGQERIPDTRPGTGKRDQETASGTGPGPEQKKEKPRAKSEPIREEDLVGQTAARESLNQVIAMARVNQERESRGLKAHQITLHAVFSGSPGTGKTTFARFYAEQIKELGILKSGHLVEVSRQDLVAEYAGQTASKTGKVVESALGGVLFIDEAYSLKSSKDDAYGQEAIDSLLKLMEDHRDELIVILAGYTDEMRQFLQLNPGLKSRVPNHVEFQDFSDEELGTIFDKMCAKVGAHVAPEDRRLALEEISRRRKGRYFGNAREVRNLFERAIAKQATRLSKKDLKKLTPDELSTLTRADLTDEPAHENAKGKKLTALEELEKLRGLDSIKAELRALADFVSVSRARSKDGKLGTINLHLAFLGNPGTGKTTVARLLGRVFRELGVLPGGHLVETDRSGLVAEYQGQTAVKTKEKIQDALGGVLFVDEAYTLSRKSGDSYGQEAIDTLLKAMEDHRGQFVLVVSGYGDEMHGFLDSNPGLKSRFAKILEFPDYSNAQLAEIAADLARDSGYELTDSAKKELERGLELDRLAAEGSHFGNARAVRNRLETAFKRQASRLMKLGDAAALAKLAPAELNRLEAADFQG